MNETLQIIMRRRSTRDFLPEHITEDELQTILKAGMYAPYGEKQSRIFTVIRNKDVIALLNDEAKKAAVSLNMPVLKNLGLQKDFNCFYGAPLVIILSGTSGFPGSTQDCSAAAQNMLIAAESINVGSCWLHFPIFAFYAEMGKTLKSELQIPESFEPLVSIALGYKRDKRVIIPPREISGVTYIS